MQILFGFKDVGGTNAIFPVVEKVQSRGDVAPILYADGVSFERFKAAYPLISTGFNPEELLKWFKPQVVVTTTCSPGGVVPVELVIHAKSMGIKTVVVQDYWGNHLKDPFWKDSKLRKPKYLPDLMCVQDEFAKRLVLENWPEYSPEQVIITGQPAFDRLRKVRCDLARPNLRRFFNLSEESWPVVHFSGQIWGQAQAIGATIEALNMVGKPVYFFLRDHPRLLASDAPPEYKQYYEAYKDLPYALKKGRIINSSHFNSSDSVNAGADIVMGISSTAIVEACYLGKWCISTWVPEGAQAVYEESAGALNVFPPVALGACLSGSNAKELARCFERIFRHEKTREIYDAQKIHFLTDGKSAERVYEVISNAIG